MLSHDETKPFRSFGATALQAKRGVPSNLGRMLRKICWPVRSNGFLTSSGQVHPHHHPINIAAHNYHVSRCTLVEGTYYYPYAKRHLDSRAVFSDLSLYASGLSLKEVAAAWDLPYETVRTRWKKHQEAVEKKDYSLLAIACGNVDGRTTTASSPVTRRPSFARPTIYYLSEMALGVSVAIRGDRASHLHFCEQSRDPPVPALASSPLAHRSTAGPHVRSLLALRSRPLLPILRFHSFDHEGAQLVLCISVLMFVGNNTDVLF
jgi:hypothetical protein